MATSEAVDGDQLRLRVMTYNIRGGRGSRNSGPNGPLDRAQHDHSRLHGTDNLELAFARRELGLALGQLERYVASRPVDSPATAARYARPRGEIS